MQKMHNPNSDKPVEFYSLDIKNNSVVDTDEVLDFIKVL
jgi:hypothetical protein